MKRISNDNIYSEVKLVDVDMGISAKINIEYLIPGVFVKCIYVNLSYIGLRNDLYTWSLIDDICWIHVSCISSLVSLCNT